MLLRSNDSHGKRRQVFLNEVASSLTREIMGNFTSRD